MLQSKTARSQEEGACPNTQKTAKKHLKISPIPFPRSSQTYFITAAVAYENWLLLFTKQQQTNKKLATSCPSDQITVAQGPVGAELFWNSNGAFATEQRSKEFQNPSIISPISTDQWENKMGVELWDSQFPDSMCPTSSPGYAQDIEHTILSKRGFSESL